MSEPFIGEIRIFTYNFAPDRWAYCDGQLVSIAQNQALFSILNNRYGGDGYTQFALPNLKGRAPMHQGRGVGLTSRVLGEKTGSPVAGLNASMLPPHSHTAYACTNVGDEANPADNYLSNASSALEYKQLPYTEETEMSRYMVGMTGNGEPHNNMQPYLTLPFCIAMDGMYPPRT